MKLLKYNKIFINLLINRNSNNKYLYIKKIIIEKHF